MAHNNLVKTAAGVEVSRYSKHVSRYLTQTTQQSHYKRGVISADRVFVSLYIKMLATPVCAFANVLMFQYLKIEVSLGAGFCLPFLEIVIFSLHLKNLNKNVSPEHGEAFLFFTSMLLILKNLLCFKLIMKYLDYLYNVVAMRAILISSAIVEVYRMFTYFMLASPNSMFNL